jgi:hypothetical protein
MVRALSIVALATLIAAHALGSSRPYKIGEWVDITGPTELVLPDAPARPGFTFLADHDPDYARPLRDDTFLLKLPDPRGPKRPPIELRPESRDGRLKVAFADLTGDGVEELVTICRIARSSEPRDEILQVWLWSERPLSRILDVLVRGNEPAPWWYTRGFRDVNGDGVLELELIRGDDASVKPIGPGYLLPPAARTVAYAYDHTDRVMKPVVSDLPLFVVPLFMLDPESKSPGGAERNQAI